MTVLTIDQMVELTEVLSTLAGIAITWAIYHGSDAAELPGQATTPDPSIPDDPMVDTTGRTL